jgi:hypothetical protein
MKRLGRREVPSKIVINKQNFFAASTGDDEPGKAKGLH